MALAMASMADPAQTGIYRNMDLGFDCAGYAGHRTAGHLAWGRGPVRNYYCYGPLKETHLLWIHTAPVAPVA